MTDKLEGAHKRAQHQSPLIWVFVALTCFAAFVFFLSGLNQSTRENIKASRTATSKEFDHYQLKGSWRGIEQHDTLTFTDSELLTRSEQLGGHQWTDRYSIYDTEMLQASKKYILLFNFGKVEAIVHKENDGTTWLKFYSSNYYDVKFLRMYTY